MSKTERSVLLGNKFFSLNDKIERSDLTTSCAVINKWKVFLVKPNNHMVLSAYHNIDRGFDENK